MTTALDDLETSFLQFALPIVHSIASVNPEDIDHTVIPTMHVSGMNLTAEPLTVADIGAFMATRFPNPYELPGAQSCVDAHCDAGIFMVPPHIGGHESMPLIDRAMVYPSLSVRLRDVITDAVITEVNRGTLIVEETELLESYRRHRDDWTAQSCAVEYLWPVFGFSMQGRAVHPISDELILMPFTDDAKSKFIDSANRSGHSDAMKGLQLFLETQYVLALNGTHVTGGAIFSQDRIDEVGDFVTALRLFSPGMTGIYTVRALFQVQTMPEMMTSIDEYDTGRTFPPYQLEQTKLDAVLTYYHLLRRLRVERRDANLLAALHHFNQSYTRKRDEDRLLDLTIALESSILAATTGGEFRFRMALRGVAALTQAGLLRDGDSRIEYKRFFTALYDVRSKIVHEGRSLTEMLANKDLAPAVKRLMRTGQHLGDAPTHAEDAVRQILRMYLIGVEGRSSVQDINTALDDHLIRKLSPLPSSSTATGQLSS
jgi:Apea-like HEPN